jgi:hypothetical protein
MDKPSLLCEKDKALLREFSSRAIRRLSHGPLRAFRVPFVDAYLDANVLKEVEKDRLIIERAAAVFASGEGMREADVDAVFEETKGVDRNFVNHIAIPALSVTVRYEDIAEIRKRRIRSLSRAVSEVLGAWTNELPLEDAVRAAWPETRFRETLTGILHLYNLETRILGRSLRLLPPFHAAAAHVTDALFDAMEAAAKDLVDECAKTLYQERPACLNRT